LAIRRWLALSESFRALASAPISSLERERVWSGPSSLSLAEMAAKAFAGCPLARPAVSSSACLGSKPMRVSSEEMAALSSSVSFAGLLIFSKVASRTVCMSWPQVIPSGLWTFLSSSSSLSLETPACSSLSLTPA